MSADGGTAPPKGSTSHCQTASSTSWGFPALPANLNPSNRPVRTRMPGGVAGGGGVKLQPPLPIPKTPTLILPEPDRRPPPRHQRQKRGDKAITKAVLAGGGGDELLEADFHDLERGFGVRHQCAIGKQFYFDVIGADRHLGQH